MMMTRVVPADEASIGEAARLIARGDVVAFPTETVYGLGANALDGRAVRKIFSAKGRPADNPLIVHVASLDDVAPLIEGDMPDAAKRLAEACWPGPLTMIMRRSGRVPDAVTTGLDTVGIRMPAHPVARRLIASSGVPIAAPSANRSGRPSPTLASHVMRDMEGRIALILDGGACDIGLESTVLDVTVFPPRVLRPGGVTSEQIAAVVGAVEVDGSVLRPLEADEVARSPGMKYRHYAPRARMTIVRGNRAAQRICQLYDESVSSGEKAAILAMSPHLDAYGSRRVRALGDTAQAAAASFFAALREMDDEDVTRIFSEAVGLDGVGLALMNRMGRAAAFDMIDADE